MKDAHSNRKRVVSIAPEALSADKVGAVVDRQGFESVEYNIDVGVGGITFTGTNKIEFVLQHSDDGSNFSDVEDAHILGKSGVSNGILLALTTAHAAGTVHRFGYVGGKRYTRLTADFSGTHGSPTPIAASVDLGHPANEPVADQA
jgi:hypothetical protein